MNKIIGFIMLILFCLAALSWCAGFVIGLFNIHAGFYGLIGEGVCFVGMILLGVILILKNWKIILDI